MQTRRQFLVYLGMGSYSMMRSVSALGAPGVSAKASKKKISKFSPIHPSKADALVLPPGFHYDVVASYGDPLGTKGPQGPEFFGYDNDFISYFSKDALLGGKNPHNGLLWVNHEFLSPLFVSGAPKSQTRTKEQLRKEHQAVGGSIIEVQREKGKWKIVPESRFARRFTADYPEMKVSGPARTQISQVFGTLANCSGGRTFWNTALSGEENFQLFNPAKAPALNWGAVPEMAIKEDNYGWIVEVDPFGEIQPTKHTALGRFSHENACLRIGASGHLAVYMGDDAPDQFLYKFVSRDKHTAALSRIEQSALLDNGTLYAADLAKGVWISLDFQKNPALAKAGFRSQADISMRTRQAAKAVGATPMDRPEDCEIDPADGSVYVSLTNNSAKGNMHGQILRLIEDKNDAEAEKFRYEIFLAGGPDTGLSCPDNLVFDKDGNLWVTCDISSYTIGKGVYEPFGNNGLFMIPMKGAGKGEAFQFASSPVEAELTGPCFNTNSDTLFLSVQHPGEDSPDLEHLTSHWPSGKGLPKPSVVAITGFSSK